MKKKCGSVSGQSEVGQYGEKRKDQEKSRKEKGKEEGRRGGKQ